MALKKLRILHITTNLDLSYGTTRYVLGISNNLIKNKNIRIYLMSNGGDALNDFERLNILHAKFKFREILINSLFLIFNYQKILRFCLQNKIDIIHTHHRYPEFLAFLISKTTGCKTITTAHSFVKGYKLLSFNSDKIITVSYALKQHLIESYNIRHDKIIKLYNFVDNFKAADEAKISSYRTSLKINSTDKIILFAGRVSKIKGCDILIKAFQIVKDKIGSAKLFLVGSKEDFFGEIEEYIDENHVFYFPPTDNIEKYYLVCDLVVLPSREDPFPYVMLEAGMTCKPFIGGNTGGIKEFIEDKEDGLLVEPGNVKELADAMQYMLTHEKEARIMGNNLFRKVSEKTNKEEYVKKLIEIYSQLLTS